MTDEGEKLVEINAGIVPAVNGISEDNVQDSRPASLFGAVSDEEW